MQTDYYDRAMRLAYVTDQAGLNAEYTAHSLGGGMASAMSAVTGQPATTFNAAGLHPDTARRFAQQNPGVQVYDTGRIVTAYQAQGELLNDGVQNNIERMDVLRRQALGGVLQEVSKVVQHSPTLERVLDSIADPETSDPELRTPPEVRQQIDAFLNKLANSDTDKLLKELPLAAGQIRVLDQVKTWQEGGRATDRVDQMVLEEVAVLAAPALEAADFTLRSANLGRQLGEAPARGMNMAASAVDRAGDAMQAASTQAADFSNVVGSAQINALQQGVRIGGEGLARGREAAGVAEAAVDHLQGEAQARLAGGTADGLEAISRIDLLPDGVQRWAGRSAQALDKAGEAAKRENLSEASEALQDARRDARAIRDTSDEQIVNLERVEVVGNRVRSDVATRVGERMDTSMDIQSAKLSVMADGARDLGSIAGGTAGALTYGAGRIAAAAPALNPAGWTYNAVKALREADESGPIGLLSNLSGAQAQARLVSDIAQTVEVARHAKAAGGEAFQRHLMTETVSPSMEARTDALENAVRAKHPSLGQGQRAASDNEQPATSQPSQPGLSEADQSQASLQARVLQESVRLAVEQAERGLGKRWDEHSERLTASLTLGGVRQGFSGSDALQVGFSKQTDQHAMAERAFLHRGGPDASVDPAANRVMVATADALSRPAEEAQQNIQQASQERLIAQRHAQQEEPTRDQQQGQQSGPSLG